MYFLQNTHNTLQCYNVLIFKVNKTLDKHVYTYKRIYLKELDDIL